VDDFPAPAEGEEDHRRCKDDTAALTGRRASPSSRIRIILCPLFFKRGTIEGGEGREWPGVDTLRCSNLGDRVTDRMKTVGHNLLHEYTHIDDIVQPPLDQHAGNDAYGFYDKRTARFNADSYTVFATELTVETGKVIPIIYLSPRTSIKCVE